MVTNGLTHIYCQMDYTAQVYHFLKDLPSYTPAMKTAIVILNWNGRSLLEQFLPDLVKYSSDAELWVIDNASTDDSCAFLQHQYPQIKQVELDQNYGFAKGYNLGLNQLMQIFTAYSIMMLL